MKITQKEKLIILREILLMYTDLDHSMTMSDIMFEFEKREIFVERKSLYKDIKELNKTGIKIEGYKLGREYYYHVTEREFELAELKLLADAVHSSKFITVKKSKELVDKLSKYISIYDFNKLNCQITISDRIKSMNESIYLIIDSINEAMTDNNQICFRYYKWSVEKKLEYKHEKKVYQVSPWELVWNDEFYYLVGYDHEDKKIKHFRIDKIATIQIIKEKREGKQLIKENNSDYSKMYFGMFGGERRVVKIQAENEKIGVFIDRFGKNIIVKTIDENTFEIEIAVIISNMFFGWILGLGNGVKIISPDDVVDRFKYEINSIMKQYK